MKQTKEKKKRGIRDKILKRVLVLTLSLVIALGVISAYLNYHSTNATLKRCMTETVEIAAERTEWEIITYENIVKELGCLAQMSDETYSDAQKQEMIDQKVKEYGLSRGKLISADGIAKIDGTDYSDREYFKQSMKGEVVVTEPMIAKTTGELSIIISAPVWKDGVANSEIAGVVFVVPQETFLNDIVESIKVSEGGSAYILDAKGNTIAHKNMKLVKDNSNTMEDAKKDSSLKKLAKIEKKMVDGKQGFDTYMYKGERKFLAYMPIGETNGWSIAINAPTGDFMKELIVSIIITVIIVIAAAIITTIIAGRLARGIANPIQELCKRFRTFAQGDLTTEFPKVTTEDEVADLIKEAGEMAKNLAFVIKDAGMRLTEMAGGNYTLESTMPEKYVGEFSGLDKAMLGLNQDMNETLYQIGEASSQVSAGSGNLAEAAQSIAEGATDQAGAIEELLAVITNLTEGINHTSNKVKEAYRISKRYAKEADKSSEEMQSMVNTMENISETSNKIESIIAEIEEIAAQTNLLALNASIEAARAGEAGRGFAVVADQISKLADESSQSAISTKELITSVLSEIEIGTEVAGKTAEAIDEVVKGINQVAVMSKEVSELSEEQAEVMNQAEQGVNQIADVVQSNSAVAEEASATSEELAAQSISLDELIHHFKLKEYN